MRFREMEGAVEEEEVERGVGVIGGFDEQRGAVVEDAVLEGDGAEDGGELVVERGKTAAVCQNVAAVAVDVEAVYVAVLKEGGVDVVGAEDAPFRTGIHI